MESKGPRVFFGGSPGCFQPPAWIFPPIKNGLQKTARLQRRPKMALRMWTSFLGVTKVFFPGVTKPQSLKKITTFAVWFGFEWFCCLTLDLFVWWFFTDWDTITIWSKSKEVCRAVSGEDRKAKSTTWGNETRLCVCCWTFLLLMQTVFVWLHVYRVFVGISIYGYVP